MCRARPSTFLTLAIVLISAPAATANAQDTQGSAFSLQNFRPAIDGKGYITVNASEPLGHLDFSLGLVGSYAHDVLHLSADGRSFEVEHLLTSQLQFALGLFKFMELGLSLPVHVMAGARSPQLVDGARGSDDLHFSGQFIGDVGLHLKARVLDSWRRAVGLGALLSIYAPTGKSSQFLGEGQVTIRPELIVDKEFGRGRRFRVALNAGALIRPATHSFTDRGAAFCAPASAGVVAAPMSCGTGVTRALGTQLSYSFAVSAAVVPQKFELVGEAFGYADVSGNSGGSPLEGLLAAKVHLAAKSYFEIGGGAGLLPASITKTGGMTGSPQFRLFVGFIFEPAIGDRDGDGLKDNVDRCPDDPEDFDGFEDEDGCPDPDNDRDGLFDRDDRCPNEPGPVENHGCPWPDRDKDGVFDQDDACPDDPGPAENQGCPLVDSDGDGLFDRDDECPHEAGPKDNHGCPLPSLARLRGGHLLILKPIFFETNKAIIKSESYPTLNDVAETLQSNQQLVSVEIQGHADERGDDDSNLRLTDARAAAVKRYLVDKGVSDARLEAHGYGETRPLCSEHAGACWARNRRVEFIILKRSDNLSH